MSDLILQIIESLKTKISELNYNNWIRPVRFSLPSEGLLKIGVPNKFIRDWIQENYLHLIQFEAFRLTTREHQIVFEILEEPAFSGSILDNTPDFSESSKPENPRSVSTEAIQKIETLNPKYRFDSFVVGSSNQFAHAAAQAVAENPAKTYNPLFLYGGVGLGKTHLLCAIGNAILSRNPAVRIVYVTGEHFTNEVIRSIRQDKMFEFRKKYRDACDVFVVDDVQFIAGKERTQEEFFHTFNFLYESRRQIVMTSDRLPKDIQHLEERLRSRFEWGLIADLQLPDIETRAAILKRKAEQESLFLPDDVALFLAANVRSNIRELEGLLTRVSAFHSLTGISISIEVAKDVLKNQLVDSSRNLTVETIQKLVSDHYRIKVSELKSDRRLKNLTQPRQIAMYLCRKYLKASFPELGIKFGGKDHSTVVHAVQKIEKMLSLDAAFRREMDVLEKILSL